MIQINNVNSIQKILIDLFGGKHGVRDKSLLESAIARPYSTFDGNELYASIEEKASAIIESILINHLFVDGNKRIGYVLMRLILLNSEKDIEAREDEKYKFVISIASGNLKFEGILDWITLHIKR